MLNKLIKTLNELEDFTSWYEMKDKYPIGTKFKIGATLEGEILPGGIFEHGGEGGEQESEVYIKCNGRYFETPASYSSYGDSEIYPDQTFEIEPYECIVLKYKKKGVAFPKDTRLYTPPDSEETSYDSYDDNSYE